MSNGELSVFMPMRLKKRGGRKMVLVPEGYELSRTTIVFLLQSARHGQVREPVLVRGGSLIPQADSENA